MSTPNPSVTIDQVNQQYDDLQAAVDKEHSDLTTYIQGLKDQLTRGNPVTQAQLDALSARITGTTKMVQDFDINTTQPPAPPTTPLPPTL